MSLFQRRIKKILEEIFGDVSILEEVPVKKLFKSHRSGRERYDLVIPSFNLIIECHGEQHKSICSFGADAITSYQRLIRQKRKDIAKEEVAILNEWSYAIIWHDEIPKKEEEAVDFIKVKVLEAIKN